jgi:hypothetical protein
MRAGGAEDVDTADLEIVLERGAGSTYTAQLRVHRPDSEVEDRVACEGLSFDHDALLRHAQDPARYGEALTRALFGEPALRDAFVAARGAGRLRIRLSLGSGAADLHALRWETLRDPQRDAPLLHDPRILFSRYLGSFDWRPVRLRPREELRALVVVADPADLPAYQLTRVDVAAELARAREGLRRPDGAALAVSTVVSAPTGQPPGRATLARVLAELRDGCDILYLVCHGVHDRARPGRSALFLEDDEGKVAIVEGAELVRRLHDLEQRPRLVVLASCQSAGADESVDGGPLVALGPRLAEAGVPAVLAMQGRVRVRTVARFMPVFFRELASDGRIDRAVAVARGAIEEPGEAWRPVLFMRLRRGRVWYEAGFSREHAGLSTWPSLCQDIQQRRCTPFLGPGLLESIFEHRARFARRWADEAAFPMAPFQREDLTQVAEYLAITQKPSYPAWKLTTELIRELRARLGLPAPDPDDEDEPAKEVMDLLDRLRTTCFHAPADDGTPAAGPADPYAYLAALPLPAFVTTGCDDLLVRALRARGKQPEVGVFAWQRDLARLPDPFARDPDYEPSVKRPLVYHLFGHLATPRSLVLTQDDHFDFLLAVRNPEFHDRIPGWLRARFNDSGLLFLGFEVEDWAFRVVFRTLLQQEGAGARDDYRHVAAQVEPEEGRVLDPVGARRYLENSLKNPRMDIYWGTLDRFLRELAAQRRAMK